jgi:PAS domain S-box-containing protein
MENELVELRQQITGMAVSEAERKRFEVALQTSFYFLEIANRHAEMTPLLEEFVAEIKNFVGCAAVGIRILGDEGDIPYQAYEGFSQRFYESESPLSIKSDLCMCINIVKGLADPRLPFYTEGGSFYVNGTTRFLATVSEEEKGQTRNVCNRFGYESVALVPIRLGQHILGLIHLADPGENMFSLEMVEVLEGMAMQLGTAIQRVRAEEELRKAHDRLEIQVEERTAELAKANEELRNEIAERKALEEMLRRYEFIANTSREFMTLIDADHTYRAANESYCRAQNKTQEEIIGKTVADVWGEERYLTKVRGHLDKCFAGEEVHYQEWFEFADLGLRCFAVHCYPYYSAGTVTHAVVVSRDVTEWVQAEGEIRRLNAELEQRVLERTAELRESEELYRTLIETSPDAIALVDLDRNFIMANQQSALLFGFRDVEELLAGGKSVLDFVAPEDRQRASKNDRQRVVLEKDVEYTLLREDGTSFPAEMSHSLVVDANGGFKAVVVVLRDITERKLAEETLERRMKQLTALNQASQAVTASLELDRVLDRIISLADEVTNSDYVSVVIMDEEGRLVRGTGTESDVLDLKSRVRPDGQTNWIARSRQAVIVDDVARDGTIISQLPEGAPNTLNPHMVRTGIKSFAGLPLIAKDRLLGVLYLYSLRPGNFRDQLSLLTTFAHQAAIAIQNARLFEQVRAGRQRLKTLSRRLVEVQETERSYIARELHDEAGQALASLIVSLSLLEREADCPEAVVTRVAKLKHGVRDLLENLRRLAADLRPASLDSLGLVAALRQYLKTFGHQHSLAVQFETVDLEGERLPPQMEIALYRIVQESLTNVVRHAGATQVTVLLRRRGDQVIAIVEDDGIGFDPEMAVHDGRLGLLGMRERAETLNGTLVVRSVIGEGTTVFVGVPYVHSHSDS